MLGSKVTTFGPKSGGVAAEAEAPPASASATDTRTTAAIGERCQVMRIPSPQTTNGESRSYADTLRHARGVLVICPSCEADNRSGARFCRECGAALEHACPACGA